MKSKRTNFMTLLIFSFLVFFFNSSLVADETEDEISVDKLAVVWTSGDSEVAEKVCLMYTHAAKQAKWFEEVILIVWGPSARILAGDKNLQKKIKEMIESGIKVQACVVCSDSYGVSKILSEIGVDVKPMGRPLSELIKSDWKVLTF